MMCLKKTDELRKITFFLNLEKTLTDVRFTSRLRSQQGKFLSLTRHELLRQTIPGFSSSSRYVKSLVTILCGQRSVFMTVGSTNANSVHPSMISVGTPFRLIMRLSCGNKPS